MILFLNFAPLSFGGGVERWLASVAELTVQDEEVEVLQVDRQISDLYAQLVLQRKFDPRTELPKMTFGQQCITWNSLVPFTPAWREVRATIKTARIIYTKFEVNETLLLLYFGGFSTLKRTIIGLHSPFFYLHKPLTFFETLHNIVYSSFLSKFVLSHALKVHVLNPDQEKKLIKEFALKNICLIPNFIENEGKIHHETNSHLLKVCFIGELSMRKGADILLEIIAKSPNDFQFDVAGDGPLKNAFLTLSSPNVHYHGYVNQDEVGKIISNADVLLMPSRAESFSLASLDALSRGLVVICSSDISPNALEAYLVICKDGTAEGYLTELKELFAEKKKGRLSEKRKKTAAEIQKKFSKKTVVATLKKELFGLGK